MPATRRTYGPVVTFVDPGPLAALRDYVGADPLTSPDTGAPAFQDHNDRDRHVNSVVNMDGSGESVHGRDRAAALDAAFLGAAARYWHPVARAGDVGPVPLRAVLCEIPLVLWRRPSGAPAALVDRCPHRSVPLSDGSVDGAGSLRCRHHAWAFDAAGRCVDIPQQPGQHIPDVIAARPVRVEEAAGLDPRLGRRQTRLPRRGRVSHKPRSSTPHSHDQATATTRQPNANAQLSRS